MDAPTLVAARSAALAGDYLQSLAVIENVLGTDPDHLEALLLKGNVLELEQLEEALTSSTSKESLLAARRCYERVIELAPGDIRAHVDLGTNHLHCGDAVTASKIWDVAVQLIDATRQPEKWEDELAEIEAGRSEVEAQERTDQPGG